MPSAPPPSSALTTTIVIGHPGYSYESNVIHLGNAANQTKTYIGQTIAGGGRPGTDCYDPLTGQSVRSCANQVNGFYAVVGGGVSNQTTESWAVVAGGISNSASGLASAWAAATPTLRAPILRW